MLVGGGSELAFHRSLRHLLPPNFPTSPGTTGMASGGKVSQSFAYSLGMYVAALKLRVMHINGYCTAVLIIVLHSLPFPWCASYDIVNP